MTAYEQTGTARPVRRLRYRAANLLDWVMLGLLLAGIALFILYPIVSVVSTSFFGQRPVHPAILPGSVYQKQS